MKRGQLGRIKRIINLLHRMIIKVIVFLECINEVEDFDSVYKIRIGQWNCSK